MIYSEIDPRRCGYWTNVDGQPTGPGWLDFDLIARFVLIGPYSGYGWYFRQITQRIRLAQREALEW